MNPAWAETEDFKLWLALARHQKIMSDKEPRPEDPKPPCADPIWPGECAPKPGTTIVDPERDEKTIIPVIR